MGIIVPPSLAGHCLRLINQILSLKWGVVCGATKFRDSYMAVLLWLHKYKVDVSE